MKICIPFIQLITGISINTTVIRLGVPNLALRPTEGSLKPKISDITE